MFMPNNHAKQLALAQIKGQACIAYNFYILIWIISK